jgi:hypothetical protein
MSRATRATRAPKRQLVPWNCECRDGQVGAESWVTLKVPCTADGSTVHPGQPCRSRRGPAAESRWLSARGITDYSNETRSVTCRPSEIQCIQHVNGWHEWGVLPLPSGVLGPIGTGPRPLPCGPPRNGSAVPPGMAVPFRSTARGEVPPIPYAGRPLPPAIHGPPRGPELQPLPRPLRCSLRPFAPAMRRWKP